MISCSSRLATITLCLLLAILVGCSGSGRSSRSGSGGSGGGYYKDDGPGANIPANIAAIPNAVPRIEPHRPANARPYVVFGKQYIPISTETPFRQQGTASWYGRKFHGNKTANGETYDMYAMTAAHPTLPLPSYARVTHARSGATVIVRINDRGPFHSSRIIDLSYVAAAKLNLIGPGSGQVVVEAITHSAIRNNSWNRSGATLVAASLPPAPPPQAAPVRITPNATPDALGVLQQYPDDDQPQNNQFDNIQAKPTLPTYTAIYQPQSNSSSSSSQQIYLQFGAFGAEQSADSLVNRLNNDIQTVESRQAHVQTNGSVFRVQIGPYPTRTDAVNAALRIQQQTGMASSIAIR